MDTMPTGTFEAVTTYSVIMCSHEGCGVTFALDDEFIAARRRDRKTWYCPNGHGRWYPGKSETEKTREAEQVAERLRQQLRRREEDVQRERRQHAATKGKLTKERKRVANGVCPCCNRHFVNVERHMANQHPEFVTEADA